MPSCPVTLAYLDCFVAQHKGDFNALVEAQVEQAIELKELAAQVDASRRVVQLRSFLLLEAIITRPRAVLDPIFSTTWERSRKGLNHVLRVVQEARTEINALDAEHTLGGTQERRMLGDVEVKRRSRQERVFELIDGCATLLRRSLRTAGAITVQDLHHIGRWGLMAIMVNNTPSEAMNLARELLEQTSESNRRAWETQTP
jgi:hypothetical protein